MIGATGMGSGTGTVKNLHTPDGGLTWLVDLITLPAMNPQGTQTPAPSVQLRDQRSGRRRRARGGSTGSGGSAGSGGNTGKGGSTGSGGSTGKGGNSGSGGSTRAAAAATGSGGLEGTGGEPGGRNGGWRQHRHRWRNGNG